MMFVDLNSVRNQDFFFSWFNTVCDHWVITESQRPDITSCPAFVPPSVSQCFFHQSLWTNETSSWSLHKKTTLQKNYNYSSGKHPEGLMECLSETPCVCCSVMMWIMSLNNSLCYTGGIQVRSMLCSVNNVSDSPGVWTHEIQHEVQGGIKGVPGLLRKMCSWQSSRCIWRALLYLSQKFFWEFLGFLENQWIDYRSL